MEFLENGFPEPSDEYLRPTEFFNFENAEVAAFTDEIVEETSSDVEKSVRLFYAIRDTIR